MTFTKTLAVAGWIQLAFAVVFNVLNITASPAQGSSSWSELATKYAALSAACFAATIYLKMRR